MIDNVHLNDRIEVNGILEPLTSTGIAGFKNDLVVTPLADGRTWKLGEHFVYECKDGDVIEVPAGFVTDFASIPRGFWNALPPWGKYGPASVIHDFLYSTQTVPKERADSIFLEAMKVSGVESIERDVIYEAVKEFGHHAWNMHTLELNTIRSSQQTPTFPFQIQ